MAVKSAIVEPTWAYGTLTGHTAGRIALTIVSANYDTTFRGASSYTRQISFSHHDCEEIVQLAAAVSSIIVCKGVTGRNRMVLASLSMAGLRRRISSKPGA